MQLCITLDAIMFEKNTEGIGQCKERDFVTEKQEDVLWKKGLLGEDTPDQLRITIFFLLGRYFGLHGGSEHRDLVHYPTLQIKIEKQNNDGNEIMLVYREFKSKMNQGGLTGQNVKKAHVAYAFPNKANVARCPVRLFIKYVRYCPIGSEESKAFYLRTNVNWMSCALWYTRQPIRKNLLNDYLKNLMVDAGFVGNFMNHSLRATTATRLFQNNCPKQLIAEQTGHSSNAIRRYKKKASLEQKKDVSKLLAGESVLDNGSAKLSNTSVESEGKKQVKNPDEKSSQVHVEVPKDYSQMAGLVNIHFHFKQ